MLLKTLVDTSTAVGATRKRNEKTALLAECISQLTPDAIEPGVSYLAGELRQGKIGLGYAKVSAAQADANVDTDANTSLTVLELDETLSQIASVSGKGSTAERARLFNDLLARTTADEQSFIKRLIVGELRQGALESLVVDAIAKASDLPLKLVRRARMLTGDLPTVAKAALFEDEHALQAFTLELFNPIEPMLAGSAETVQEALDKFGRAAFELKLDGARVQVHKHDDEVRVYTRQLNDVTAAVPEVVETMLAININECVLDGEVIALRDDKTPLPFQTTMRRFGRRPKNDESVAELRNSLPLSVFFFDCLALNGEMTIDQSAAERAALLKQWLPEPVVVPRIETDSAAEAQAFLDDAFVRGHEGVMAKSLDAPYEAGRRGAGWLKLKQAHTLDLIVIAAEWGSGRRKGFLSNLHLAARNDQTGEPVMLGKTFKGMTDVMLEWQTKRLLELQTHKEDYAVFVKPELVVEVAFNDVQVSQQYPGGVALRFARIKAYREDKTVEQADTLDTVKSLLSD